jgi:hypothetical protein
MDKLLIKNPTYGADFELFLFNSSTNSVINAKPYVKGTKDNPYNFDPSNKYWCTSLDNISFEGNIAPCTTAEEFNNNIVKVIDYLKSSLPKGIVPIHECAVRVNPSVLNSDESMTFGCEPSLDAYTGRENDTVSGETTNLRTCCTHIHMRYDNMTLETSMEWIKAMDLFLGVPSTIIEPANERRSLYGKLGEMRFYPERTVEYRSLSSYFSQNDIIRKWVFNNTLKATGFINEGHRVSDDLANSFKMASINHDEGFIKNLINQYNIPMPL